MAKNGKAKPAGGARGAALKGRFNPEAYLASAGVARKVTEYEKGDPVFSQGVDALGVVPEVHPDPVSYTHLTLPTNSRV